jgi:predicted acyltransferase
MNIPEADNKTPAAATPRHAFIDQCRGYAIFGMILVNVLGIFSCMPWMLKHHHEGFSYADHIAPMFMFVVGIGFRMSFLKTVRTQGLPVARKRALRRYCILMGLGLIYGGFSLRVGVWDALMDIGMAGVLALPFMHTGAVLRLTAACVYLALFQLLFSCTPYGAWLLQNSINGGPLGPLSWVFILLMGTFAADCIFSMERRRMFLIFILMSVVLCACGWLLRMEWGSMKAFWPFSQFAMTAPYPVYATGLCFITVLFFYVLCERFGIVLPHLSALGRNPLVLYLLQAVLVLLVRIPVHFYEGCSASVVCALASFSLVYGACYLLAYRLHSKGKVIKI